MGGRDSAQKEEKQKKQGGAGKIIRKETGSHHTNSIRGPACGGLGMLTFIHDSLLNTDHFH